jgi:hypothetical protein
MLRSRSTVAVAVAFLGAYLGAGCGSSGTLADAGVADANPGDVVTDSAADQSSQDPCTPGTCRSSSDSSGPCLPPGGPIGLPDSGASLSGCCACGDDGLCSSPCTCASPDTPIATPGGDRPIASLSVGDLVMSIDHGHLAAVPIRETHRAAVTNHRVVEIVLRDGATLHISAAHPTADGRFFGQLQAGDWLGGGEVTSAAVVPYAHDATYDILPDSDTGTYFAGGALIGSTLAKSGRRARHVDEACTLP